MSNWTGAGTGAIGGASAGASIGSAIPGVGTAIGAGVGGLFGGIAGLFGKNKKKKRISTFDKKQATLNDQQSNGLIGEGPLADLYNYDPQAANDVFDQTIGKKAYRDLNEKAIPSVTGQFRKEGLMNSSYSGDAIAKLARDVQENLDSQRSQFLYGEQKEARSAKRSAIENFQNRNTSAYAKGDDNGGFDINAVLKSITPEMTQQLANYFKKSGR